MLDEFLGVRGWAGVEKTGFCEVWRRRRTGLWDGRRRGLILFREVNELNRTPEASIL